SYSASKACSVAATSPASSISNKYTSSAPSCWSLSFFFIAFLLTSPRCRSRVGKNGSSDRHYLTGGRSLPWRRSRVGKNGGRVRNHLLGVGSQPVVAVPNVVENLIQLALLGRGWA